MTERGFTEIVKAIAVCSCFEVAEASIFVGNSWRNMAAMVAFLFFGFHLLHRWFRLR